MCLCWSHVNTLNLSKIIAPLTQKPVNKFSSSHPEISWGYSVRPALKKRLWHRCFPASFVKFLRTPFLSNTSSGYFRKKHIESTDWFLCYRSINFKRLKKEHFHFQPGKLQIAPQDILLFWYQKASKISCNIRKAK